MTTTRRLRSGIHVSIAILVFACGDLPRDPANTLEEARNGVLRVGVTAAPPWVTRSGATDSTSSDAAGGIEVALVRAFAAGIGAEVEWVWGGAEENLNRLERRELAIVAAGLTQKTPWAARVGLTRPHTETGDEKHVLAAAPGENALLVALERHIERP